MKTTRMLTILVLVLGLLVWPAKVSKAAPVGTAFTYQGRLIDANEVADGLYDFQFKLCDSETDGNQLNSDVNTPDVEVIDGYFTVELDFGDVFDGNNRWLQIGVRPGEQNDPNVYTVLSPLQKVTPTPYALYAKTAGSGGEGTVPGPGELRCFKQEVFATPALQWTTICNITDGPALVTNLWFATYTGGRVLPMRISFDGQDPNSAQIIGLTGELFASGFDDDVKFRNHYVGVSRGTSSNFSGYLKLPMPYYSSIKVEVYGGGCCWFMLERIPITNKGLNALGIKPGMLLRTYGYGLNGYKVKYSELTLLDQTAPTILAGLFQFNVNDLGSNWYFLEGNYKIYYGGSGSASYENSGTEDFYHSSWYFTEGAFAEDDECMAVKSSSGYRIAMSRFFPLWRAPYHQNGLKLTWNVGQNGQGDPAANIYTRWIVWYYQ